MKKFIVKLFNKAINKSVNDVVSNSDVPTVPEMDPVSLMGDNSKKALCKFIIQTMINILAAVLTALGATSCVAHLYCIPLN